MRRERGLYEAGELPETVLPNSGGGGHPAKGTACPAAHVCHEPGQRREAAGRQYQGTNTAAGGGSPGTQHVPDHGDVLRKAGQQQVGWGNG